MEKIIFVDRDGVINVDPIGDYVTCWEDFCFEKGALEGLKLLSGAGYGIVVISNQAGVGDGIYPESQLWRIHENMVREFQKQRIRFRDAFYCLHGKEAICPCRKPATGLFEQASGKFQFERSQTYFIGDKPSDIDAGKRFGLKTIFVRTGHGRLQEERLSEKALVPDHICESLWAAAKAITP